MKRVPIFEAHILSHIHNKCNIPLYEFIVCYQNIKIIDNWLISIYLCRYLCLQLRDASKSDRGCTLILTSDLSNINMTVKSRDKGFCWIYADPFQLDTDPVITPIGPQGSDRGCAGLELLTSNIDLLTPYEL